MESNKLKLMKIRDFGEVLNASFQFLKNEWKPIGKLLLYYFVPFLVIASALQSYAQTKVMGLMTNMNAQDPESMIESYTSLFTNPLIIASYFFQILIITMLMGILYSYFDTYLKKGQGNFTMADISPILLKNSIKALGISIVIGIASTIGFIFCFLPGIFVANSLSLAAIAYIIEKKGFSDAMSRSWSLVKTQWWITLLIGIIGFIIVMIIGYVLGLPLTILTVTKTILSAQSGAKIDIPTWYFIAQGFISMISTVLYIIPYTFFAFQYFNLIEREERPSLLDKIDRLEENED